MLQPFVGRRGWIPCRVIQYPKYSISNLAKCVFICGFVLALPIHFLSQILFRVRAHVRIILFCLFVCIQIRVCVARLSSQSCLCERLSPVSLSHERTFSRHFRHFSNGEHDVTSKSSMYTRTYSKSEKSSNMHS